MKKDFKKKGNTLSFLNKSVKAIDFISKALSTAEGENDKIRLLETDITYPAVEISAKGELKEDSQSGAVYIERELSLRLAPLIGITMTLDLLQVFAAWYRADVLLAAVREKLLSQQQAYEEGGNAAYFWTKFWLVADGDLNFSLVFKSDAKNEWEWQKDESVEATLTLTMEANIRAGVRFYIAEGALEIGGKAIAKGCLGLYAPTKDQLDLVLYHEGITAKVYVNYTVGVSSSSKGAGNDGADMSDRNSTNKTSGQNKQAEKEWVIHDKLEKYESKHRFNII